MKKKSSIVVRLPDVLRIFWQAIQPQKLFFYLTLFGFFTAEALSIITPLFYKNFFDLLSVGGDKAVAGNQIIHILFGILGVSLSTWLFFRGSLFIMNRLSSGVMARLRQNSFDYMMKHSYSFFADNFTGSLTQRLGRLARSFDSLYDTLVFNIIPIFVSTAGAIVVVWFQKPVISYIIIVWIIIIMTFSFFFSRWKLKYDTAVAEADSSTSALLSDAVTNQNNVTLFTAFAHESLAFKNKTNEQAKMQEFTWNLESVAYAVQALFFIFVEFIVFYYGVKLWQQDLVTIGTFVLIQVYLLGLMHRLWNFGNVIRGLYQSFADSKEMVEILMTPYSVKDLPNAVMLDVKKGGIDFQNVSFGFHESNSVLDGINISFKGGQKIALIGPSGAGKSTFVRLLLRMYDLTSGKILIDGQDIFGVTQDSLRKNISLVPQDPVLFHRTLLENIRYGRLDATDEEVRKAAKLAHCDEFIDVLPLKYDTYVGERGIKLSGGERQRVAIARAILKNAPILILDEATSSLDSHSESLIQDALEKLMKGKTSIVIAHRLSTIRKMDRIVVVDGGKVVEDGNHDDLLANENSLYKKLWELQAGGFLTV